MRTSLSLLTSLRSVIGLTSAIAFILLAANFTITNAQQQLTSQPREIENGRTTTAATTFQSTTDSFRLQIPKGWVIHTLNNSGSTFEAEVLQGYRILAQLCPGEQQQGVLSNANNSTNSSNITASNRCQVAQGEEVIYIVRYPDLGTRLQLANNVTSHNTTTDNILLYHLQKLQQVGYRGIRIVNSTETTVNLTNAETNKTVATVPAKLVEMTYSTNLAPQEIKRGYFILTATNATTPNPGTTKGYSVFYEGRPVGAAEEEMTTVSSSLSAPISLPPAIREVFDSFELIAAPEVAQVVAQEQQAAETSGGGGNGDHGGNGGGHEDGGAHDHTGGNRESGNNGNNGAHDHTGGNRESGERHNQGDGNRDRGQGLANRIIKETEDRVKRIID